MYTYKFYNLDRLDHFLESCKHILTQYEIDNMSSPMTITEIESALLKLQKKKSPGPDGHTGEFFQPLEGELILILHNLFQKIEK